MEYIIPISIFCFSLIPLGIAQLIWIKRNVAGISRVVRERINGRYTGANIRYFVTNDGKEIDEPTFWVFAFALNTFIQPMLLIIYFTS